MKKYEQLYRAQTISLYKQNIHTASPNLVRITDFTWLTDWLTDWLNLYNYFFVKKDWFIDWLTDNEWLIYRWSVLRVASRYSSGHVFPDVENVLRRKGDSMYVKCLEFDGSHNSWIHEKKNNVIWYNFWLYIFFYLWGVNYNDSNT